jgi:anaerobic selenocysteine-containing dehydrogenase
VSAVPVWIGRPSSAAGATASLVAAFLLAAGWLVTAQAATASDTHLSSRCATFRAKGDEYGVYVGTGHVKCSVAKGVLKAIADGKGKYVNNGFSANSYTLYGGWLCPSGNMGEQTCEHSKRPVSNPSQDIVSLSCTFDTGCPKQTAVAD